MRYNQMPSFSSDQPDSTGNAALSGPGGGRRQNSCIPSEVGAGASNIESQRRLSNSTAMDAFTGANVSSDTSGDFLGGETDEKSVKVAHLQQQVGKTSWRSK